MMTSLPSTDPGSPDLDIYVLPASFAQKRLWFLDQWAPGSAAYNTPFGLRLTGRLDVVALEQSFTLLMERHEILRTVFVAIDGEPFQVVNDPRPFQLQLVDLPASDHDQAALDAAIRETASQPFDLRQGPLLRAALFRRASAEHVLILTLHHIVSDAWSVSVLVNEVATTYAALLENRPPALPALAIQYADYAIWQQEWLQGETLDQKLAYWRRHLGGAPEMLALPTDRPRPAERSFRGGTVYDLLPAATVAELTGLGQGQRSTLFMTLLAAFHLVLWRYSNQPDIVIGTPVAGRNQVEVEGLIGFFINTLALRIDGTQAGTFAELLAQAREVSLNGFMHQEVPFEHVVEALQPTRTLSATPLFQVMFVLQNMAQQEVALPQLRIETFNVESGETQYDLSLILEPAGPDLRMLWEYNSDIFDQAAITRMAGHFRTVLEQVCAAPQIALADIRLVGPAEQRQLAAWNDTAAELGDAWLPVEISRRAAEKPDAPALIWRDQTLTYGELEGRANRLARWLQDQGIGPERRVALYQDRTIDLLVSMVAIMKAGGAYVPLDPAYPARRNAQIIRDAGARLLLTQESLRATLPECDCAAVSVDTLAAALADYPATAPALRVTAHNLAYMIYTSGSTGTPKGVMIDHGNLRYLKTAFDRLIPRHERTVWPAITSICFDISLIELFWTLSSGFTVLLIEEAQRLEHDGPFSTAAQILRHGATYFQTTPTFLRALLDNPRAGEVFAQLRFLMVGGEALPPALGARLLEEWPGTLVNAYGPTEATVWATTGGLRRDEPITIGLPLSNASVYVVDAYGNQVPPGVPGQLLIGGLGVARGYAERPALTAERFIPDAFGGRPGARLYQTGDLVRQRPDGAIEYLGRLDYQVKLRGFRIEIGEIEAGIAALAGVRAAVVLLREDSPGEQRLVGYVAAAEPGVSASFIRAALETTLPDYMIPAAFVLLDELPLTPTGKIDRRALPQPDASAADAAQGPDNDPLQTLLWGIWSDVLGHAPASVQQNFYQAGGHSLLATQVAARINAALNLRLPLRALFEAPTIAGLAERILAWQQQHAGLAVPPLQAHRRPAALPLSFAQERLWFLAQLNPESTAYTLPFVVRLRGELAIEALEHSLSQLIARHETLRTRFVSTAAGPEQVIDPARPARLAIRAMPADASAAAIHAHVLALIDQPFDLGGGPLLRMELLQFGPDDHILVLLLHHIIADAWSMEVLIAEVGQHYAQRMLQKPLDLPALAVQYADYALWQRGWLRGSSQETLLAYWKRQLRGGPDVLKLPLDHPRPAHQTYNGASHWMTFAPALQDRLKALSQAHNVTLFMTLLAAFKVLLARLSGQSDIVVGTPIANRTQQETEGLIGFFVNTLALRSDLRGPQSFSDLLEQVRQTAIDAYVHQDMPFDQIVEALQPARSLSYHPIFQVLFGMRNALLEDVAVPGLKLEPVYIDSQTAQYDLVVMAEEQRAGLHVTIEYNTDIFAAATIERWAALWQTLLEAVCANPATPINRLDLVSAGEHEYLVCALNCTATAYPGGWIHTRIAEQAARTPAALAVSGPDGAQTYRELNERANQLARYLLRLGVRPEDRVGIYLERSPDLLVALLAVLKAGAAYVPLDPAYPEDRLLWMLDDARPRALLTQASLQGSLPLPASLLVVALDQERAAIAAADPAEVAVTLTPDQLAYVIYTSGSTGRPKGVMLSHRALVNHMEWLQDLLLLQPGDRILQKTPLSFDAAGTELYAPLMYGAQVVLGHPRIHQDSQAMVRALREQQITVLQGVPSLLRMLLLEPDLGQCQRLRAVICAGEPLPGALVTAFNAQVSAQVYNFYGPTEAAIDVTAWPCPGVVSDAIAPIGRPISNTSIYLLDPQLQPVPIGVAGECYIGGWGVARGYANRPDMTAERFVPDPFGGQPGARLYRTGDLMRYRADGTIEYIGRIDHQIKLRGYRIEISEIETVIAQHPAVREAVVIVREDTPGDQRLVAYVVAGGGATPAANELRQAAQAKLPDYMLPAAFMLLEALPLAPNGKLDRSRLPAPDFAAAMPSATPQTEPERMLAAIWAEVLHLPASDLDIDTNFFDLGGHSLLATQVLVRIRETFRADVALRTLFEAPTIRQLAAAITRLRGTAAATAIQRQQRPEQLPLSFAQERLWFIQQLDPANTSYTIPLALRLAGALDREAMQASLNALVMRHEALRTTFPTHQDQPIQRIAAAGEWPLQLVVAAGSSAPASLIADHVRSQQQQPFDLEGGPLVRASLLQLGPNEHVLTLTMHHIIGDAWSTGILARELIETYLATLHRREPALPALPIQYADYALWQRARLDAARREELLRFWRQQLRGIPDRLPLPADRARPDVRSGRGQHSDLALDAELLGALQAASRQYDLTMFMLLLGVFQLWLARSSNQDDVVVGTPIAGRPGAEAEPLIGFFVNTLALRLRLAGDPTLAEFFAQVRETTLGAYAHQDLPFESLVEDLHPPRSRSHTPIFQVLFGLQNTQPVDLAVPGLALTELDLPADTSKFDLTVMWAPAGDSLHARVEYASDIFDPATIERLIKHYVNLLQQVASGAETLRLSGLQLTTAAEQHARQGQRRQRQQQRMQKLLDIAADASGAAHDSSDQRSETV